MRRAYLQPSGARSGVDNPTFLPLVIVALLLQRLQQRLQIVYPCCFTHERILCFHM